MKINNNIKNVMVSTPWGEVFLNPEGTLAPRGGVQPANAFFQASRQSRDGLKNFHAKGQFFLKGAKFFCLFLGFLPQILARKRQPSWIRILGAFLGVPAGRLKEGVRGLGGEVFPTPPPGPGKGCGWTPMCQLLAGP